MWSSCLRGKGGGGSLQKGGLSLVQKGTVFEGKGDQGLGSRGNSVDTDAKVWEEHSWLRGQQQKRPRGGFGKQPGRWLVPAFDGLRASPWGSLGRRRLS